jgi:hypothetical protein
MCPLIVADGSHVMQMKDVHLPTFSSGGEIPLVMGMCVVWDMHTNKYLSALGTLLVQVTISSPVAARSQSLAPHIPGSHAPLVPAPTEAWGVQAR